MMISREEICDAFDCLIQTMRTTVDLKRKVKFNDNYVMVGSVLQHAEELHKRLTQEKEKMDGGGMHMVTQNAYIALMKKIEEADRIIKAKEKE